MSEDVLKPITERAERSGSPTEPSSPDSIEYSVAVRIARNRFGPGVDMGGAHNPRPSEWRLAREIVEDVRASSPQPDIDVATVLAIIRDEYADGRPVWEYAQAIEDRLRSFRASP